MLTCASNFVVTNLRTRFDQRHDQLEVVSVHEVCLPEQLQIVLHHSLQEAFAGHMAVVTILRRILFKLPGHTLHRNKGH